MKERRTGGERESERDGEKAAEIEKHDESEMAKGEGGHTDTERDRRKQMQIFSLELLKR